MDADSITLIVCIALLVLLSGFFSGSETAFTGFSKTRMKTYAQDGKKSAKLVLSLSEKYNSLLTALLIGNNIVNITAASLATVLFVKHMGDPGVTVSTIVLTLVVLVFGEITPKTLANDAPEKVAMAVAPFVKFIMVVFTPFILVFGLWKKLLGKIFKVDPDSGITEEELITIVEEAQTEGGIDEHESELIRSAIEFNDLEAESILTPRVDIVAVEEHDSLDEVRQVFHENSFSRLPVYRETIDNIIGVIHERDFNQLVYDGEQDLSKAIHDVVCITKSMKISKLLRLFQEAKVHMAIVVDEYGGTVGLVTLEDVLEGLVGEIWDEHDEVVEDIKPIAENEYLVDCSTPLDHISDLYEFEDDEVDSATVGGWVVEQLGKIPEVGDTFEYHYLTAEVTKTEHRRAVEVKITVNPVKEEQEDEKSESRE